jgi:hypothetical protein
VKLVAVDNGAVPRFKLDDLLAAAKHCITLKDAVYLNVLVPMSIKGIFFISVKIEPQRKRARRNILVKFYVFHGYTSNLCYMFAKKL